MVAQHPGDGGERTHNTGPTSEERGTPVTHTLRSWTASGAFYSAFLVTRSRCVIGEERDVGVLVICHYLPRHPSASLLEARRRGQGNLGGAWEGAFSVDVSGHEPDTMVLDHAEEVRNVPV